MKQPEENLHVLSELRKAGQDITFLFVGDGSMRQELEVLAEKLCIFKHVRFAGNRSQEVIANLLPQARLVLSPHMGRALAEACT
jgi:glycosyltransferase involved in cell wall biosynthesis